MFSFCLILIWPNNHIRNKLVVGIIAIIIVPIKRLKLLYLICRYAPLLIFTEDSEKWNPWFPKKEFWPETRPESLLIGGLLVLVFAHLWHYVAKLLMLGEKNNNFGEISVKLFLKMAVCLLLSISTNFLHLEVEVAAIVVNLVNYVQHLRGRNIVWKIRKQK